MIRTVFLGFALAMDAFSVSIADGLQEKRLQKHVLIAGVFGSFQFFMPLLGWFVVHMMVGYFRELERFIPLISFLLLAYIGGEMLLEAWKERKKKRWRG